MGSIYNFASETGSTVVSGLTATAAEYQSQVQQGGPTYGVIKYTFSGSPSLASVLVGHKLTITGFTNAENNASGMDIYAVDDINDTISILSLTRTDATKDETGASGAGTVTTLGAAVQAPSVSKVAQGFKAPEVLNDAHINWAISQMAAIVQSAASRAQNVYAGPSAITSSSYADLDGAGVSYGLAATASDQSWTASANDGAYESISGLNLDPVIKDGNPVLHVFTAETSASQSRPNEYRVQVDASTEQSIVTNQGGYATDTQQAFAASFALVVSGLSVGSRDFDVQAERYTGLGAALARSVALELHATDDDGNALVRFFDTDITEGTFGTSYADMAGFTSGSKAFQNGNKALILFGASIYTTSGAADAGIKIQKDGVDVVEWPAIELAIAGVYDIGQHVELSRVVDVTGSHTFKAVGKSAASANYSGGNAGHFGVIELPAEHNGQTLMRYVDEMVNSTDDFTNTSYEEKMTSGSVACNGHGAFMLLSGVMANYFDIQFKLDGSNYGPEFNYLRDSTAYDTPVNLLLWVPASSIPAGNHTFSVEMKLVGSGTVDIKNSVQFAAFEMPVSDPEAGNAPSVTLTDTTGKKVELTYTGSVNASNAALSFQITENIDGGGAVADGNAFTFTPQSGQDTPFTFRTVVDAPASGSTAVYKLQGKIASGTANVSAGDFMAREIQADGS